MLNGENQRKIQDFVRMHAALTGGREESAPDRYYRCVVGKSYNVATGLLTGVYCSAHAEHDALVEAVEHHIVQTLEGAGDVSRAWLQVWTAAAGKKSADDFLTLLFDDVRPHRHDESIETLRDLQRGNLGGSFNAASGVAVLRTNDLLRGLVMDFAGAYRLQGDALAQRSADLHVAKSLLEVVQGEQSHARSTARVAMMFDRMDPHIRQWMPGFMDALRDIGTYYATVNAPQAPEAPDNADAAADWHITAFMKGLFGMGTHFQKHPTTLTEARIDKLVGLIVKLIEHADSIKTQDGSSLMERVMPILMAKMAGP